jgi:hypothetical protein
MTRAHNGPGGIIRRIALATRRRHSAGLFLQCDISDCGWVARIATVSIDAAALCKMADRRQIAGGILDGPLAFDNSVSAEAAKTKGIVSSVAGHADIFVVPDLETGNLMAKQLEYLAQAETPGIVLGARVPVILTSRADKTLAGLGSCRAAPRST